MKKIIGVLLSMLVLVSMSAMAFASEYVVKPGDVLWKIAAAGGTTAEELASINKLQNPNLIYPGQIIKLNDHENETMTNAQKAVAVIESIGTSNMEPIGYINPNKYIQHNLGVKDGLEGFGEVAKLLPEGSYGKNVRVIQDGDYVAMHNEYDFFGPKVGFDIFRFENGQIVEHWDNLADIAPPNPSGRTQLDGTTEVKDLDKTKANKALVEGFVKDILMGGAPDKVTDYISTVEYLQHSPMVADGLDGLGAALQALEEAGTPMVYDKHHMILGQGNFVLTVSEGQFAGEHVSFYDLFRVEEGKIVEHWDVVEQIPAKDKWMNDNGKF